MSVLPIKKYLLWARSNWSSAKVLALREACRRNGGNLRDTSDSSEATPAAARAELRSDAIRQIIGLSCPTASSKCAAGYSRPTDLQPNAAAKVSFSIRRIRAHDPEFPLVFVGLQ